MTQQLGFFGSVQVKPDHKSWLRRGREAAAQLALERGSVAAEDIRGLVPEPEEQNLYGVLLVKPWFVQSGERSSRHPGAHRRKVRTYLLTATGRRELLGQV